MNSAPCAHIAAYYAFMNHRQPCIGYNLLHIGYRQWSEGRPTPGVNNLFKEQSVKKEIVRVLRVIEYVGERDWVESTLAHSIHGEKRVSDVNVIRAATIGLYPEILEQSADIAVECNEEKK